LNYFTENLPIIPIDAGAFPGGVFGALAYAIHAVDAVGIGDVFPGAEVDVHGTVIGTIGALDAVLHVTEDGDAFDFQQSAQVLEEVHEGAIGAQIAAPEALDEEATDADDSQQDSAADGDALRMAQRNHRTELHVDILHRKPCGDDGTRKHQVFNNAKDAVKSVWNGVNESRFSLAQTIDVFLQRPQKADIAAEFPTDKHGGDSDKQADDGGDGIYHDAMGGHGAKTHRSVGTKGMSDRQYALDDEKQKHDPADETHQLDGSAHFVLRHETVISVPRLNTWIMAILEKSVSSVMELFSTTKSASKPRCNVPMRFSSWDIRAAREV